LKVSKPMMFVSFQTQHRFPRYTICMLFS